MLNQSRPPKEHGNPLHAWPLDRHGAMVLPVIQQALLVDARAIGRSYVHGHTTVAALTAASCTITSGDQIALTGASGSGKSTLLQLLGGLDIPTTGSLAWPALGSRETLRPIQVAYVFQNPSLLAPLSIVENVELPLLLAQLDAAMARSLALNMLAQMELTSLIEKLPEELSGGQAQRVAIARALVVQPQLLLADEPTGQLDRATAQHVVAVLLDALNGMHTACVIATHDPLIAERLPIRWQIEHGRLETQRT